MIESLNTIWFKNRIKYDITFFEEMAPQRTLSYNPRYKSGIWFSEKCNRNIQYESGIELSFIKKLEEDPFIKYYYEQPVTIKFRIGKRKLRYTPDFALFLNTDEVVIVEIKSLEQMLESKVQKKTEGLIEFCKLRGFGLLLTDGKNTIDKLICDDYNKEFEKEILSLIRKKIIRKKECEDIRKKYNAPVTDLFKIIIKNNLHYNSFPFRLFSENKNHLFRKVFIDEDYFPPNNII